MNTDNLKLNIGPSQGILHEKLRGQINNIHLVETIVGCHHQREN